MTLRRRIQIAADVLFRRGSFKQLATLVPTWADGVPVYPETNFRSLVKHGYQTNELIFSCIDKTARASAQAKLRIMAPDGTEMSDEHPLVALLKSPNPYMTQSDFWSAVVVYQKLAGRATFEKERNNAGQVIALWPMRPDWLRVIPSSETFIGGYSYEPPGSEKQILAVEDVVDFKLFDPLNSYNGYPPVAVAARVGDVDNALTNYLKLFFEKGGMPPLYIKTSKKVSDDVLQATRERWSERYGGAEHWSQPAVLDQDFEVHRTGLSFNEMEFEDLDARDEARICMVLNVPPLIAGAKIGLDRATYNNAPIMRRTWWEDVLIPQFVDWSDTIQRELIQEFDPRLEAKWDFSDVPALQEQISETWDRGLSGLQAGALTINEFREMAGFPPLPDGDTLMSPQQPAEKRANRKNSFASRLSSNGSGEKQRVPDDDEERRSNENRIKETLEDFFREQGKRVVRELNDAV